MKNLKLFFAAVSILGMGNFGVITAQVPVNQVDRPHFIKCPKCGKSMMAGCFHNCTPKQ